MNGHWVYSLDTKIVFQYWPNFNIEDGGQACVWVITSFLVFRIFFKTKEKYIVGAYKKYNHGHFGVVETVQIAYHVSNIESIARLTLPVVIVCDKYN